MSPGPTPIQSEFVDAMLLAARGSAITREFVLGAMPRLIDMAGKAGATAQLDARFHLVEARAAIAGKASAKLRFTCQRCLSPVDIVVDDEFHVVLVKTEAEMDQLTDEQDVVIADASHLDLVWLAEEQLLLAMPLVPTHASPGQCVGEIRDVTDVESVFDVATEASSAANAEDDKRQRPFANLRELLKK